jgi:protein-export membrane protein SecD
LNKHFIYLGIVVLLAGLAGYLFATQPIRRGLDVQGGLRMTLRAEIEKLSPEEQKLWTPERMRLVIDILSRRIDSLGVLEPTIYQKGDTEIVIELPGFTDEQEARDLLQTTARLEFRYLKDVRTDKQPAGRYRILEEQNTDDVVRFVDLTSPDGKVIEPGMPEYQKIIESSPLIVTGDELERAEVVSQAVSPEVRLIFNREGQDKFARASSLYLREHIAIVLDNKIISAPVIRSPNLRDPVIEGKFTLREATRLRDLLNAGALPVSLSLESINRVGGDSGRTGVGADYSGGYHRLHRGRRIYGAVLPAARRHLGDCAGAVCAVRDGDIQVAGRDLLAARNRWVDSFDWHGD